MERPSVIIESKMNILIKKATKKAAMMAERILLGRRSPLIFDSIGVKYNAPGL